MIWVVFNVITGAAVVGVFRNEMDYLIYIIEAFVILFMVFRLIVSISYQVVMKYKKKWRKVKIKKIIDK